MYYNFFLRPPESKPSQTTEQKSAADIRRELEQKSKLSPKIDEDDEEWTDTGSEESESEDEEEDKDDEDESSDEDDESSSSDSDEVIENVGRQKSNSGDEPETVFPRSPSKIMTRKVATKEDRSALNTVSSLLQKLNPGAVQTQYSQGAQQGYLSTNYGQQTSDSLNLSVNSSAYVLQANSPIVISRDFVPIPHGASVPSAKLPQVVEKPSEKDDDDIDNDFQIHGKFSSPRISSDLSSKDGDENSGNDSDTSYSALKISAKSSRTDIKSFFEVNKATMESQGDSERGKEEKKSSDESTDFEDEDEWGETTLKLKSPQKMSEMEKSKTSMLPQYSICMNVSG